MFLGHYAVALAAKRTAPRTSLGTLFFAAQLADMAWPVFLLAGWERVRIAPNPDPFLNLAFDAYPISHSLLTLAAGGVLLASLYGMVTGYARGAVVVALAAASHWLLDFATHRPDMPLYPGGPVVGLGLWNSVAGTIAVEGSMFLVALWLYARGTRARDRVGRYGFWGLMALLVLSYVSSLLAGPPPSVRGIAIGGVVFGWLFVLWAGWADGHREATAVAGRG